MAAVGYEAQREGVREFFADPGDVPTGQINGHSTFTVKQVARELEISETRAGDILVELERAGELERSKLGRAFVYWRATSPGPAPEATPHADHAGPANPPAVEPEAEGSTAAVLDRVRDLFPPDPADVTTHRSTETLSVAGLAGHEPVIGTMVGPDGIAFGSGSPPSPVTGAALGNEVAAALAVLRDNHGKAYCGAWTDPVRNVIEMTAALHLEQEGVVRLTTRRSYTVAELVDLDQIASS